MSEALEVQVREVPLELIDRPAEPDRLSIDPEYINELAQSIAETGLINPIVISPRNGRYEIVAGDCRYQAFVCLGRQSIPAFIKELDAEATYITRASENLQRRDLTVIEEARIYLNLHDNHNMSWDMIAKRTGKSVGLVKRRCDLLKLPDILVSALHERKIGYAVAEELAALGNVGKIEYYLGYCLDHGATKEVVRNWVKDEKSVERQQISAGVDSGWGTPALGTKPQYVACDLCQGPMEIGKETMLRICQDCCSTIKSNM